MNSHSQKKIVTGIVKDLQQVAKDTFCLSIHQPYIARNSRAGQFVNVRIPQCSEILWRRPFSVHSVDRDRGTFELLFNPIGRGTRALSSVQVDSKIDILGPLGNHFPIDMDVEEVIIVAGGLGVAPFKLLLQELGSRVKTKMFYGVSSVDRFCCLEEFSALGAELLLCTDDGTKGERGFVTDLLSAYFQTCEKSHSAYVYVCGPTPMMHAVQILTRQVEFPAFVSVENKMACGFGACMGCPVVITQSQDKETIYKLACKDGPVFPIREIRIDEQTFH